jgi:hypothetical protein
VTGPVQELAEAKIVVQKSDEKEWEYCFLVACDGRNRRAPADLSHTGMFPHNDPHTIVSILLLGHPRR